MEKSLSALITEAKNALFDSVWIAILLFLVIIKKSLKLFHQTALFFQPTAELLHHGPMDRKIH